MLQKIYQKLFVLKYIYRCFGLKWTDSKTETEKPHHENWTVYDVKFMLSMAQKTSSSYVVKMMN